MYRGGGAGRDVSPANSTSVFLLRVPEGGGSIVDDRALFADEDNSASFPEDGMRLSWRRWRGWGIY